MQATKQLLPLSEDGRVRHQKVKRWQECDFVGKLCHHKKIVRYCDGAKHGNTDTFINGRINVSTPYADGKRHGKQRIWFKNGMLASFTHYVEGREHGIHKTFHGDGRTAWELRYVCGKVFDEETFWTFGDGKKNKKQSER
ncbi:MORN repeat-containing protein [Tokyovirus A1]|uniref:MORN repeat-containing protein n=1 Tax=Tokyovirus A1 TaxID=1826170 RepID=UPI0007A97A28|nr:MORN repeat-containing protein [Tokyovirus A1]BAU80270.1 MORN repeat-containing protein [Tokyovirus A1]